MHYKIYTYEIEDERRIIVAPDRHFKIFQNSVGYDAANRLAVHRGRRDSILMEVRVFGSDFTGRIGRHLTEREVSKYDSAFDKVKSITQDDDDFPNTWFIAFPRLGVIAVRDGASPPADSAIQRLHAILIHRQKMFATFTAMKAPIDLRQAVERFKVTEVTFEVFPVNPHTASLGMRLDEERARDHIRKWRGKAEATPSNPIQLGGGLLTAIQQLQQSGHATIGFKGVTQDNVAVSVPRQRAAIEMTADASDESVEVDVKLSVDQKIEYPVTQSHVTHIRTAARHLKDE